jgi:hypothetical protein
MSDKLEINFDSTSMGAASCTKNFFLTTIGSIENNKIVGGYKSLTGAAAMYGVAVHKFVDTMYKTNGYGHAANKDMLAVFNLPKDAPPKGKDYLVDEKHLQTTAWNLWNDRIVTESVFDVLQIPIECYWCGGKGGKTDRVDMLSIQTPCDKCNGTGMRSGPATEITFKIPVYEDEFCMMNLCGTIDTVGQFRNGCFAIRDWKTTSSFQTESFMTNFELSRQLRFYTLACKLMTKNNPESILGRVGATNMGAFIDAIFLNKKANDNEYVRSDVFTYSDDHMGTFHSMLMAFCEKFSKNVKENNTQPEGIINGACTAGYPRCRFWNICKSNPTVAGVLLSRDFTRKLYNPLSFNEIE